MPGVLSVLSPRLTQGQPADYRLWVILGKDEAPHQLIGEHSGSSRPRKHISKNEQDRGTNWFSFDVLLSPSLSLALWI